LDIGLIAAAHAQASNLSRAEECIARLHQLASRQYVTPLAGGFAAIGIGDFDLAFQCLDEAINDKILSVLIV
jgi:serine/threonine-protein kinase